MREARNELEGSLAPRLEQRDKAVDQLEGERGEEEKQVEEWVDHPGGQVASEVNTPTCHNLTKVAAVVRRGSTVQITRQIRFCKVTCRLASTSSWKKSFALNVKIYTFTTVVVLLLFMFLKTPARFYNGHLFSIWSARIDLVVEHIRSVLGAGVQHIGRR